MASRTYTSRLATPLAALLFTGLACTDVFDARDTTAFFDVQPGDVTWREDLRPDTGPDSRPDTRPDTGPDTGPDTRPDTRPDTGVDTTPDTHGGCRTDAECPASRPHCQPERGVCVQCASDLDCQGGFCDLPSGSCHQRPCWQDQDCFVPAEVCSSLLDPWSDGYCVPSCIPFVTQGSGCPPDQWCLPSLSIAGIGACTWRQFGGPAGSPCDPLGNPLGQGTCADDHLCLDLGDGGVCYAVCDPAALPGSPGDRCIDATGCLTMSLEDPSSPTGYSESAFGVCSESCDYHADVPCLSWNNSCVPGELFGIDLDVCVEVPTVPEREPCDLYGLEEGDLCGPISACIGGVSASFPGVRCWDLCIPTPDAPLGLQGHPDCRRQEAICEGVFASAEFGLCY